MSGPVTGEQLFRLVRERERKLPVEERSAFRARVLAQVEELLATPPAQQVLAEAIREAIEGE